MENYRDRLKQYAPYIVGAMALIAVVLILVFARPALTPEDIAATREAQYPVATGEAPEGPMRLPVATVTRLPFKQMTPGLFGYCQQVKFNSKSNWGYNNAYWGNVEPTRGTYVWTALDAEVAKVGSDSSRDYANKVMLQISHSEPIASGPVPSWITQTNANLGIPNSVSYPGGRTNIWSTEFMSAWEDTIAEFAERYDNDKRVEAVLITIGDYGETNWCKSAACDRYDDGAADVRSWISYAKGIGVDTLKTQNYDAGGYIWTERTCYEIKLKLVEMIDLYKRHFISTPIVLQLGSGINRTLTTGCLASNSDKVGYTLGSPVEVAMIEAVAKYGKSVWMKKNSWGDGWNYNTQEYDHTSYDGLYGRFKLLTRTSYEHGQYTYWDNSLVENQKKFDSAITAGLSSACLGSTILDDPTHYPLPTIATMVARLKNNYATYAAIATPNIGTVYPTYTPTASPTAGGPTSTATFTRTPTRTASPTWTSSASTSTPTRTATPTVTGIDVSVSLQATDDTWLSIYSQSNNFGGGTLLQLSDNGLRRAMLRFDVSSIPAGVSIKSATLRMNMLSNSAAAMTLQGFAINNNLWTEMGATWLYANSALSLLWGQAGGDYNATVGYLFAGMEDLGVYNFDITSLVGDWYTGAGQNAGIMLLASSAVSQTVAFASSEYGDVNQRPQLNIVYVQAATVTPTPTTGGPTVTPTHTPTNTPTVASPTNTPAPTATWPLVTSDPIDTFISAVGGGTENYSSYSSLQIYGNYNYPTGYKKAILLFGDIPLNSTVITAELYLYVNELYGSGVPTVVAKRLNKANLITQTTWISATDSTAWIIAGAAHEATDRSSTAYGGTSMTTTGWKTLDMTTLMRAWASGSANRGVLLEALGTYTTQNGAHVSSINNAITDTRPYMNIVYATATTIPTATSTPVLTGGLAQWTPVADTNIREAFPNNNYATTNPIGIRILTSGERRILAKWDLSVIPANSTIISASVQLYNTSLETAGGVSTVVARKVLRDWVVDQATWISYTTAAAWAVAGAGGSGDRLATNYGTPQAMTVTDTVNYLDVSTPVAAWYGGEANYGLLFLSLQAPDATTYGTLAGSMENATEGKRPFLFVMYATPTPTATNTPTITPTPTSTPTIKVNLSISRALGRTPQPGDLVTYTLNISAENGTAINASLYGTFASGAPYPTMTYVAMTPVAGTPVWAWNTGSGYGFPAFASVNTTPQSVVAIGRIPTTLAPGIYQVDHYLTMSSDNALPWDAFDSFAMSVPTLTPTTPPTATATPTSTSTPIPGLYVNEVYQNPLVDFAGTGIYTDSQYIEIYNDTASSIDLSWGRIVISNTSAISGTTYITYVIPYGIVIGPGSFLAFYRRDTRLPLLFETGDGEASVFAWVPNYAGLWTIELRNSLIYPAATVTPGSSYGRYGDGAASLMWIWWPIPGYSNSSSYWATVTPTVTPTPS